MASGHVIDLISSDDEATSKRCPPPKSVFKPSTGNARKFLYPSHNFNCTHTEHDWDAENPPKRRKLGPPEKNHELPVLAPPSRKTGGLSSKTCLRDIKKQTTGWIDSDDEDPIVYASSSHQQTARVPVPITTLDQPQIESDNSDDSLPDDILTAPVTQNKVSNLSERTAVLLASLSEQTSRQTNKRKGSSEKAGKDNRSVSRSSTQGTASDTRLSAVEGQAKDPSGPKRYKLTEEERIAKVAQNEREKEARAKERESARAAKREQKAMGKEKEKERKRLEREAKEKEKQIAAELAEVNKAKIDKKDSTVEMIVDLPTSLDGQTVITQTKEFLKNVEVDTTLYQSPVANMIKWRRKMKAKWNLELERWEPLQHMQIEEEKHVMCLLPAKEFASLAMSPGDEDIDIHVAKLKSAHPGCIPIYLIEGLHAFLRRIKTAENRAYQAKVLNQSNPDSAPSCSQQAKRKKSTEEPVDEDKVEDALLRLQVMNECLVHHAAAPVETAEWITHFTQHISTIPYRYVLPPLRYILAS